MYQLKKAKIEKLESGQTIIASVFMFAITVIIVSVCWLSAFGKPPLYYKNLPFGVSQRILRPGDRIRYAMEQCNDADQFKTYTLTRYLQSLDGKNPSLILEPVDTILPPGCTRDINDITSVPQDIKPGKYRILGKAEVKGDVKPFYIDWYTEPFTVK
jgi:hypothetical protein